MKLNCVNIPTQQPEAMRDFYALVLDAPWCSDHGGPNRYEIPAENATVVVQRVATPPVVHPEGCGLEWIVEDVEKEYRRLVAAGLQPLAPPETLPWGWRFFALKDPDENNPDIVQVPEHQ